MQSLALQTTRANSSKNWLPVRSCGYSLSHAELPKYMFPFLERFLGVPRFWLTRTNLHRGLPSSLNPTPPSSHSSLSTCWPGVSRVYALDYRELDHISGLGLRSFSSKLVESNDFSLRLCRPTALARSCPLPYAASNNSRSSPCSILSLQLPAPATHKRCVECSGVQLSGVDCFVRALPYELSMLSRSLSMRVRMLIKQ